jgi:hypothetical protein
MNFIKKAVFFLLLIGFQTPCVVEARIVVHYKVTFDLADLPDDFNISALISVIADLNASFAGTDIDIEGVRVTTVEPFYARLYSTQEKYSVEGRVESSREILDISYDLAMSPEKIKQVLDGTVIKNDGQERRREIADARREALAGMFDNTAFPGEEQKEGILTDKIAKASIGAVKRVGAVVAGDKASKNKDAVIEKEDATFFEIFSRGSSSLAEDMPEMNVNGSLGDYKFSIEGIDADTDGIRDDVKEYIQFNYSGNEQTQLALYQMAKIFQDILIYAEDPIVSIDLAERLGHAQACLVTIRPSDYQAVSDTLIEIIINTDERGEAYLKHYNHVEGVEFPQTPQHIWPSYCEFNANLASTTP